MVLITIVTGANLNQLITGGPCLHIWKPTHLNPIQTYITHYTFVQTIGNCPIGCVNPIQTIGNCPKIWSFSDVKRTRCWGYWPTVCQLLTANWFRASKPCWVTKGTKIRCWSWFWPLNLSDFWGMNPIFWDKPYLDSISAQIWTIPQAKTTSTSHFWDDSWTFCWFHTRNGPLLLAPKLAFQSIDWCHYCFLSIHDFTFLASGGSTKPLSGWWLQPLWKILVSWDDYSQYTEK